MLIAAAALVASQRRFIYPAPKPAGTIAEQGFAAVDLETASGLRLTALYRTAAQGRPTIVFFHGNGDSLRGSLVATRYFATLGYGVLLPEYPGYGGNPGSPSEQGFYAAGRAALDFLRSRGVTDGNTVVIGNSLGSGTAAELAAEHRLRGIVIVSGYTSLPAAVAGAIGTPLMNSFVLDRFDTLTKLPRIKLPMLIVHGDADRVISVEQGRALHRAAVASTYREFSKVGHELVYEPECQRAIAEWLATI